MDGYIKKSEAVDVIVKYPYDIAGKTATAIKMIEDLPRADVVPRSEVDELICKLECFLCHATGGRLSKHTYDLQTMETVVTDYINETYNDGYGEGYKDCASEIFAEIETVLCYSVRPRINANGTITPIKSRDLHIRTEDYNTIKKKYTEGYDDRL